MDLSPYLDSLRRDLAAAAAPAGEQVATTANLLSSALEASARLCFIEVLADATAEITAQLDGPIVEVRLRGRDADLVVTGSGAPEPAPAAPPLPDGGGEQARLTLRLPETLKDAIEKAAAAENISVNSWLVRAAAQALQAPPAFGPPPTGRSGRPGRTFTGFAQA
jgi:hypothetical protein